MTYDIMNKTILVTGANRGIGKSIVEEFINQGAAKIYAAVRNIESVESLVTKYGDKVVPIQVDLSNDETIIAAAKIAQDVDVVINNGGVGSKTSVLDTNAMETLAFELDVNVYGLIRIARAFGPILKANGGGAFVQLNTIGSLKTVEGLDTYCASKAASYAITQGLRQSLAKQGTLVVSVHPGPIDTDILKGTDLEGIAEPPSIVAKGIIETLKNGEFHLFPDSVAKQVGSAYESFAKDVILTDVL